MSDLNAACYDCRSRKKKIMLNVDARSIRLSEWDEKLFESFLQILLTTAGKQSTTPKNEKLKEFSTFNQKKRSTETWIHLTKSEKQNLYIEVLYTIKHKIGSTCGGHSPFIQDLYDFAQTVFSITNAEHRSLLIAASEEKPPIIVLNITVIQAKDLEAKDADGFSDPYVMLGIIPGKSLNESNVEDSESLYDNHNSDSNSLNCNRDKSSRGIKNFGISLRKKVGCSEKFLNIKPSNKSTLGFKESIPAKFIQTTSVKPNTMTPVWNELFRFDIENSQTDKLHLDIWDHDDEESVFDAVKKLNEVKGVKGLSRYFKQVGQSARSSSGDVDDFLGCITIDIDNIPSIGMKQWFKLVGRNSKSRAQGEIELELKLSTREDRNISEENNWLDILQHEDLLKVFIKYEIQYSRDGALSWNGEMREEAETILHQHAIQGDMTELQILVCRWLVLTEIYRADDLNTKILLDILDKMEKKWQPGQLSRNEINLLATSYSHFIGHCLEKIKHFRDNFSFESENYGKRLKEILRILTIVSTSTLYRSVSPFENELSSQLVTAIKKSALDVLENATIKISNELENIENDDWRELLKYLKLMDKINRDLFNVEKFYQNIFAKESNIKLFQLIYKVYVKRINKMIIENNHLSYLATEMNSLLHNFDSLDCYRVLIDFFSMIANLQQFYSYQDLLITDDFGSFDSVDYYSWFNGIFEKWMEFAKYKLEKKIEYLIDQDEMNTISDVQMLSSMSATDVSNAFEIFEHIWKRIQWSDVTGKVTNVTILIQALGSCGLLYADTLHEKVRLAGYFDETGQFDLSRQVCVSLNNINHIDQYLGRIPMDLAFDQLANEVAMHSGDKQTGKCFLENMVVIIQQSRDHISGVILNIIQRVIGKMRPEIRKNIFHLCWSPQSVNVEKASSDLITYLYENISTVKSQLHCAIYSHVIFGIWSEVLSQIEEQAHKEVDDNEVTDSLENCDNKFVLARLYRCLDILLKFFIGVDENMTQQALETVQFESTKYLLTLYTSNTKEIVEYYFKEKLDEQNSNSSNAEFGWVNIKVYYKRCSGSLVVEIINARGLTPLDSNGLSDPFVIVELGPSHFFSPSIKPLKTKIIKNTLDPDFNETFEIQVKLDQILKAGATLVLTIMDHDMLMTDDLEGIVFVNLNNIPGISSEISKSSSVKPMNYIIIQPKYETNKALFVLGKHKSDLYANENLKKWLSMEKYFN